MMKYRSLLLILLPVFWLGCAEDDDQTQQPVDPDAWNLVFEDEFDSDLSDWNIWEGGAFNQEIPLYRGEQLSLEDGILKINVQREDVTGPNNIYDSSLKDFEYVSARIESKELYGVSSLEGQREYRFEARIKLPSGHGMWPAFWSYGDPWPTQGEIDILEARGGEPFKFQSNIFYGNEPNININHGTEAFYEVDEDLTADFHVYEMVWTSNTIEIFFDGELFHTYTADSGNNISNLFGKKQKIVLNTAVGGWFFTDTNSANFADSAVMEVDWVRVYSR